MNALTCQRIGERERERERERDMERTGMGAGTCVYEWRRKVGTLFRKLELGNNETNRGKGEECRKIIKSQRRKKVFRGAWDGRGNRGGKRHAWDGRGNVD